MAGILYDFSTFNRLGNPPITNGDITEEEMTLFPGFETNKVATMTIVALLDNKINISKLFHLLPITRGQIIETGKSKKKLKIIKGSGPYGCVYSAKYYIYIRGVDITKSKRIFRNSITMYVETDKKVINAKLSTNNIQMCGGTHINDGLEMANILIDHIYKIKNMIKKIYDNYEEANKARNFILELTKGEIIDRDKEVNLSERLFEIDSIKDYICTKIPKHYIPPKDINKDFFYFFAQYTEQQYHSDFQEKLDWIFKYQDVLYGLDRIAPKIINTSMVNINYKLGFPINRFYLALYLDKQDGMFAKFNNCCMPYASIEIPLISQIPKAIDKGKIDYHTIIIYRSGSITQSGQGGAQMEEVYCRFMRNIHKYKEELIKPEWHIFVNPEDIVDQIVIDILPQEDEQIYTTQTGGTEDIYESDEEDDEDSDEEDEDNEESELPCDYIEEYQ